MAWAADVLWPVLTSASSVRGSALERLSAVIAAPSSRGVAFTSLVLVYNPDNRLHPIIPAFAEVREPAPVLGEGDRSKAKPEGPTLIQTLQGIR